MQTIFLCILAVWSRVDDLRGPDIEVVGSDVFCRLRFDRYFFAWQDSGLKLVGYFLRNLALDREYIGKVTVIFFSPDMRVIAGIN